MKPPVPTLIAVMIMIGRALVSLRGCFLDLFYPGTYASFMSGAQTLMQNVWHIGSIVIALSLLRVPTRQWSRQVAMVLLFLQLCWNCCTMAMLPSLLATMGSLSAREVLPVEHGVWSFDEATLKRMFIADVLWALGAMICFLIVRRLNVQPSSDGGHPEQG